MQTQLLPADKAGIARAAQLLRAGEIVVLPTETVYGTAADATNDIAVEKIFQAKGRPQDNPLIVHIASMDMLEGLVSTVPDRAELLAKAFWPGPMTMILPRGPRVCDTVCAGLDTVGIRWPSHPVAQAVIRESGLPLAAPSANRSGSPSPTNAQDVLADMQGRLPLILDGGDSQVGVESTVISLVGEQPVLLRPGYITKEQLEQVLGCPVLLSHAILEKLPEGEKARSPGMKYKHYAPKAEVTILRGEVAAYRAYVNAHAAPGVFALCFAEDEAALQVPCVPYGSAADDASQAHGLFNALRRLDDLGAVTVYAHCPRRDGIGMAVYNRLLRAAAFRVTEL